MNNFYLGRVKSVVAVDNLMHHTANLQLIAVDLIAILYFLFEKSFFV